MSGKKFLFSLRAVLKLRRHETQQAERTVLQAADARRAQEARVTEAQEKLAGLLGATPSRGGTGVARLRQAAAHRLRAQRAAEAEAQTLAERQAQEATAQRALVLTRRPEEALETLRDREQTAHRKTQADAELAFLDEQAVVAYCRAQREAA